MANINVAGLAAGVTKAASLGNLLLVIPQLFGGRTEGYQPQNGPSFQRDTKSLPSAILFNYEGEQVADLTSDITDHYTENNTAIQDQIAVKPVTVTTHGFVGELNDIAPGLLAPLQTVANKLTTIPGYVPSLSVSALLAYNEAFQAYQAASDVVNDAVSVWSTINGGSPTSIINGATLNTQSGLSDNPNQTKQQLYFSQFYGYWANRTLFQIQTPWATFQDMAIQSLRAIQDSETRMITDFEVTFKLMRFASTQIVSNSLFDPNSFLGRAFNAGQSLSNGGVQTLHSSSTLFAGSFT